MGADVTLTKRKVYWLPNLDGVNQAIVFAWSQRNACNLMGCTRDDFRNFGGQRLDDGIGEGPIYDKAVDEPGVVFYAKIGSEEWSKTRSM